MKPEGVRNQESGIRKRGYLVATLRLGAKLLLLTGLVACSSADPVREDEEVVLFPSYAVQDPSDGRWTAAVHGWVYEPPRQPSLRQQFLTQVIGGSVPLSELQGEIFERRASFFLADNERGKRLEVFLNGQGHLLSESEENGHFSGEIQISSQQWEALPKKAAQSGLQHVQIETAPSLDGQVFRGRILFPGPRGLSVISDIDDTIKVSNVLERSELIANTFLRPFRAADGMAALYSRWAQQGASFHYVSSSPWQLYPALSSFMEQAGFPPGSFHLKSFRAWDSSFFDLFKPGTETKPDAIRPILDAFPGRTFVLVGDSGEQDPEIYGDLLRQHSPQRIRRAYIRNVTGQAPDDPRWQDAFREVDPSRWTLFTDPGEIQ